MLTPSSVTVWEKLRQQVCSLIISRDFLLLTDLISDYSGFEFFEVGLQFVVARATFSAPIPLILVAWLL